MGSFNLSFPSYQAVFSTVFFHVDVNASGGNTFKISSRWWYIVAISLPLTLLVLAVWLGWTRQRSKRKRLRRDVDSDGSDHE